MTRRHQIQFISLLFLGSLVCFPTESNAATHSVPGDFTRITDAHAASAAGDTILVGPGTYSTTANGESFPINLLRDNLLLKATAGMLFTTIDAEGQNTAIIANNPGIRITGFKITGGSGSSAGGIAIRDSVVVDSCLIIQNSSGSLGSGIWVNAGNGFQIHHNVIWENTRNNATGDPHGIYVLDACGEISHNTIGRGDSNGIFFRFASNPEIWNNILYKNGTPGDRGRGICALGDSSSAFVIKHNLFWDNAKAALLFNIGGTFTDVSGDSANNVDPGDNTFGNLDADPLFVNELAMDWHLLAGSPAIDGGDPASLLDPDSTLADIGAFYSDSLLGIGDHPALPVLFRVYPNPSSQDTRLAFFLMEEAQVSVQVFDLRGRHVKMLLSGELVSDHVELNWNGQDTSGQVVAQGVYFVRLQSTDGRVSQTLKLVRTQ